MAVRARRTGRIPAGLGNLPRAARVCRALAFALLVLGCGEAGRRELPERVLLISVDTLRADHVHARDGGLAPMPFVASLMDRGARFERAMTPLPRTSQALASLLTGRYPHGTGVRVLTDRLRDDVTTLGELARQNGFETIAVVSNHLLTRDRGLDRGFDVYDFAGDTRDAPATTAAALAALDAVDPGARLLVWVHYIDPHVPYHPPPELAELFDPDYTGRYKYYFGPVPGAVGNHAYPRDLGKRRAVFENRLPEHVNAHVRKLYAADARYADGAIEQLVSGLEERFGERWLVVFTSDHGESLGEHDFYYDHGDYVYNASTRVPLAIVRPDARRADRRVIDTPVSLVDVTPTLVELLELEVPAAVAAGFEGRSLVPLLDGEAPGEQAVFAESGKSYFEALVPERRSFDIPGRFRSVVRGDWKLIWTPGETGAREYQLYDIAADPDESRDLSAEQPDRVRALAQELADWRARGERAAGAGEMQEGDGAIPEPDREALEALGYIEE